MWVAIYIKTDTQSAVLTQWGCSEQNGDKKRKHIPFVSWCLKSLGVWGHLKGKKWEEKIHKSRDRFKTHQVGRSDSLFDAFLQQQVMNSFHLFSQTQSAACLAVSRANIVTLWQCHSVCWPQLKHLITHSFGFKFFTHGPERMKHNIVYLHTECVSSTRVTLRCRYERFVFLCLFWKHINGRLLC